MFRPVSSTDTVKVSRLNLLSLKEYSFTQRAFFRRLQKFLSVNLSQNDHILELDNIGHKDEGWYTCHVYDKNGFQERSGYLQVIESKSTCKMNSRENSRFTAKSRAARQPLFWLSRNTIKNDSTEKICSLYRNENNLSNEDCHMRWFFKSVTWSTPLLVHENCIAQYKFVNWRSFFFLLIY